MRLACCHYSPLVCIALFAFAFLAKSECLRGEDAIDFDRQIRPLLSDNCFSCHGPDAAERKADLRLDLRDNAVESGAINEDQPLESALLERITTSDPEMMMPPPKSNKQLSEVQKQLLTKWIQQGAKYTQHWSFTPPRRAEVPNDVHAVDYFVGQTLQREGLSFAPQADVATLVRRLSLDLVGLPPDDRSVTRLRADPSPSNLNAYVDVLLSSPHYGERMAISWLDVVRFADTIGYHSDTPRNVYPYRDYVIDAFNSNKPFDQFTIEQVAGDLLPDAMQSQKVASCFNRLLLTTEEGGAQAKDYEARYLGDRVRAIGTAWLGLTIGCSQCHDHKFDPITSRDFYSMGAFFADIDEAIIGRREDGMLAPTPQQSHKLQLRKVALATLQTEFEAPHPRLSDEQTAWEQKQLALEAAAATWSNLTIADPTATAGATLSVTAENSILVSGQRPENDTYKLTASIASDWAAVRALRMEALPHASLPASGSGRADNGNFVLTEVVAQLLRADGQTQPLKFATARASFEQTQGAEKHPHKRWSAASVIDNEAKGSERGWAILPDVAKPQQLQLSLAEPVDLKAGDKLNIEMRHNAAPAGHCVGHFRWSLSRDPLAFESPLNDPAAAELTAIIRTAASARTPAQVSKLRTAFHTATPALAELRKQLALAQKELTDFEASLPRCLISKSLPQPRTVRILPRGNWQDESGPTVTAQLPAFLTASLPPSNRPLSRLDLAKWLVSRENPLTARVFVNRLWKQFFGVGLSKNLDDVGAQGEAPVHGPLLDYLAVEFMDSGWDIKHMVRLIVSSRAYQQSSLATPELLQRDPENRLIARQSRYRLPAELVRDNALAIGGILAPEVGGPSVKPYQPEGYWENLNFPPRNYTPDPAPAQHRRGLYAWWQRSFVHPSLLAFDAPTREECAADRPQSNIPQQALVLLNDPTYLEAARALAVRMIDSSQPESKRIAAAFQRATAREPNAKELELLVTLFEEARAQYAADPAAAESLLKVGGHTRPPMPVELPSEAAGDPAEFAAYIQVARAILNLHEVITRN